MAGFFFGPHLKAGGKYFSLFRLCWFSDLLTSIGDTHVNLSLNKRSFSGALLENGDGRFEHASFQDLQAIATMCSRFMTTEFSEA